MVLLSLYPYSSLLAPLSQYAGPLYFNRGPKALQEVCRCQHMLVSRNMALLVWHAEGHRSAKARLQPCTCPHTK